MLLSKEIPIRWDCYSRQEAPTWFCWENSSPRSNSEDLELETALKWPQGTLGILRRALDLKLSRTQGWDLGSVTEPLPYQTAARFYMRGVQCSLASCRVPDSGLYPIQIADRLDAQFSKLLAESFVICDANVLKAWPEFIRRADYVLNNVQEEMKTLETVAQILESAGPQKSWLIIGGGITCDTAAFAAHLSGAAFTLVPTTLLAMVDASVGGKTGVNFSPYGKNLVGAFAFPKQVLIYTQWLESLPLREFYAGAGECLKHGFLIGDDLLLRRLTEIFANRDFTKLAEHLHALVFVKAQIVQRDPFENGERAILNLGHTFAHALESAALDAKSERPLCHGEAVSLGLLFEAKLAVQTDLMSLEDFESMKRILRDSQCLLERSTLETCLKSPLEAENLGAKILSYMQIDKKKTSSDSIPFVLLHKPGVIARAHSKTWISSVPKTLTKKVLDEFLTNRSLLS